MQIKEVPITKIKSDPNQPRKYFDRERIAELASSIKEQGIINPIEVDKDLMIVTGELRWRAAKEAGLKTIPCKLVKDLKPEDRFMRQVIENLHHNSMSPMDTANALARMLTSETEVKRTGKRYSGARSLAEKIGMSESSISEFLALLKEREDVKKKLSEAKAKRTIIPAINIAPEEFQGSLKDKFVSGELDTAGVSGTRVIASALRQHQDKAEEILNTDFSSLDAQQTREKIYEIIPEFTETPVTDSLIKAMEPYEEVSYAIHQLMDALKKYSLAEIGGLHLAPLMLSLQVLGKLISSWVKASKTPPVIDVEATEKSK